MPIVRREYRRIKCPVDFVFCVDCSNNGALYKRSMPQISNFLATNNNEISYFAYDWRARVVGFGDMDSGHALQDKSEFVSDIASFTQQCSDMETYNEGGATRSTLDAISDAAMTSQWRDDVRRILFVITDAPSQELHNSTMQAFSFSVFEDLLRSLCERHIRLFLLTVKDPIYESLVCVPHANVWQFDDAADFSRSFDSALSECFNQIRKGC